MFLPFPIRIRQHINAFWQFYPIYTFALHKAFAATQPNTEAIDKLERTEADLPYLRRAYLFGGAVSGLVSLNSSIHKETTNV